MHLTRILSLHTLSSSSCSKVHCHRLILKKVGLSIHNNYIDEASDKKGKARTLYQRFLAIELLHFLVKRAFKLKQETLYKKLAGYYPLMGQACVTILTYTFANTKNRIKKATAVLNLFIDASKTVKSSPHATELTPEVDEKAAEMAQILKSNIEKFKELRPMKGRVDHLKKLIRA